MSVYHNEVAIATTMPSFFEHLRALCRNHMRHLKNGELRVALQLLSYADRAGLAFPGVKRVAADAGLGPRHVRRVINSLTEKNLIQTVSQRAGRGGTALRRITMAQAAPQPSVGITGFASANCDLVDPLNGDVRDPSTVTPGVTQTPSHPPQSTSGPSPTGRGDDGASDKAPPTATDGDGDEASGREANAVMKILLAKGVYPHVANSIAGTLSLRVAEVHIAAFDSKHAKNPAACLSAMLTQRTFRRGDHLVQPEVVGALVNDGLLRKVAGIDVVGARAKHNRSGVYLYRVGEDQPFRVVPTKALMVKALE